MATNEIKMGDVVRLKSGGPKLTVESISGHLAYCTWFYEGAKRSENIRVEALEVEVLEEN